METNDVIGLIALLLTFGSGVIGIVKWVISGHDKINKRVDDKFADVHGTIQGRHGDYAQSLNNVHKRIDDVKDNYVKRVDLDRDLINIMSVLNSMEAAQRDQTKEMNSRLDRLIGIFARKLETRLEHHINTD